MIPVRSRTFAPSLAGRFADYTRGPVRRTWTRNSRTPRPPGLATKAARSSLWCSRSSCATIGRVGLDVQGEALQARHPTGAGDRRHPLGDDRLERRHRLRAPQLLVQAEGARRVRDQVAEADHRPLAGGHDGTPAARSVAPPASAVTSQLVATARRAGSRSSGVVVVMNAWGSAAIRRTRWARRSGSSSEKTSSSRRSGGRPSSDGQQVQFGQLEREDRGPLLAARRETGEIAAPRARTRGRPDADRRAWSRSRPPCRPSRPAVGPGRPAATRRGVPARSSRSGPEARSRPPRRGRSRRGRPPAARPARPAGRGAARRSRRRTRRTSCPSSAARRVTLPPRGSRAAGCCAAGASGCRSSGRPRSGASGPPPAGPGRPGEGTAIPPRAASPPARRRRPAGDRSGSRPAGRCR